MSIIWSTKPQHEHNVQIIFLKCILGCFASAMQNGFKIYNTEPLSEKLSKGNWDGTQIYMLCATLLTYSHLNLLKYLSFLSEELDGGGGVSQVQMLHRSNLIAIIGNGNGTYSSNKGKRPQKDDKLHVTILYYNIIAWYCQPFCVYLVFIWDDKLCKFVLEFKFSVPVLGVRLRNDM